MTWPIALLLAVVTLPAGALVTSIGAMLAVDMVAAIGRAWLSLQRRPA